MPPSSKENEESLKFRFDISAYRLLGRELITDRITALFELVKNSYDANSDNVTVEFHSVNPITSASKIVIKDDGLGMTFEDLRDKWMVIGTSSKRKNLYSPSPYNRKVVGKKGVGRFAVDKLGSKLILKTKRKGEKQWTCLETDWTVYSEIERKQLKIDFLEDKKKQQQFFTDIENKYWFEKGNINEQGTILEISEISEFWTESDISRSCKQLAKLISPAHKPQFPFKVIVKAPQYESYKKVEIKSIAIEYATLEANIGFDKKKKKQEILKVENGELKKILTDIRPCGFVKLTLYYFDQPAKNKFKSAFPNEVIDGVKIYRDGLIATPFAEYAENHTEQKDLLGIDKRRWSGFFERLGTRDLIGWVEISDELNPGIIDATNRQNFVENKEWDELKRFVIEQIAQFELAIKQRKSEEKEKVDTELKEAGNDLSSIRKELNQMIKSAPPSLKTSLDKLEKQVARTQVTVNKGLKSKIDLEREKKQQEDLFFSLISLQTFSSTLAHITRTIVGRIKRTAEFFYKRFPDPEYDETFKKGAEKIYFEMERLSKAIDFMLKYAKTDSKIEPVNLKETIDYLFNDIHEYNFQQESIETEVIVKKDLILNYNQGAFEDTIENLISNSLKALSKVEYQKKIKCECIVEKDKLLILFSDNGPGVRKEDQYRIFDVFFTTTSELGGAGMGLFIIKTRLEAIKGTIELTTPEFKPTGATFKITFPFKK